MKTSSRDARRVIVRSMRMTAASAAAILALTACLSGCASDPREGYSFSATHDQEVRTIAVPVFDNDTFSTGIESQLTEAIVKEIMRSTRWRVASSRSADTVLTGIVTTSELRALSSDTQTGLVQEMSLRLTVDFDWTDNRTGKAIVSRRSFSAMDTFVPSIRTGERLETGQAATIDELARGIVAELRSAW